MLLELAEDPPLLQLVHLDHRVQQLEVVAGVRGELLERDAVLRKTTAAKTHARKEKLGTDSNIAPDANTNMIDIGAGLIANVRDLIHK